MTPSSLAGWVKQARADRSGGKTGLTTDERAELAKLRKENGELKRERELLKKWALPSSPRKAPEIRVHRGEEGERRRGMDVREARRVGVGLLRLAQARAVDEGEERRATHGPHQGSVRGKPEDLWQPRVLEDLREDGERVGRNRVIRLMRAEGLQARVRRRFKSTAMNDHGQPIAGNVLDRELAAAAPNQRWVGDTTEMATACGGKFYLAAFVDLYSRFCVGWQ